MPYAPPSPPSSPNSLATPLSLPSLPPHSRHHRRSHSNPFSFPDDPHQASNAFAPLPGLPRRKSLVANPPPVSAVPASPSSQPSPRRAVFSLEPDNDSSDDSLEESQEVTKLARAFPPGPLKLSFNSPSASLSPAAIPSPKFNAISIPFPKLPGPRTPSPPASPLPRTPSTPVILSNGKPLKPSLKSSSSPNLPDALKSVHLRAQSAPSTPGTTFSKNVHFKDEEDGVLETVRLFDKAGRPASLNYGSGAEETETETENDSGSLVSYPFPAVSDDRYILAPKPHTSEIPSPSLLKNANVYLESISVPNSRPPLLRGSVLVRNVTFAKQVAIRFTFDEWQTTSEVYGSYVTSIPSLPPPFNSYFIQDADALSWDWANHAVNRSEWDRFSFVVKLEDFERKILHSTMYLAVRFTASGSPGGEWWDNNQGNNYKVAFRLSEIANPPVPSKSNVLLDPLKTSRNMFGPTLSNLSVNNRPAHSPFQPRPQPPVRAHSNPTVPTYKTLGSINTDGGRTRSRLSLSNYVAPSAKEGDDNDSGSVHNEDGKPPTITSAEWTGAEVISPTVGSILGGVPTAESSWPTSYNNDTKKNESEQSGSMSSSIASLPTPVDSPNISPSASSLFNNNGDGNDTYAEFVKKWCFHQSPPPLSPMPPPTTPRASTPASVNPWMDTYGLPSGFGQSAMQIGYERA